MRLTRAQLQDLAQNAGFMGADLASAVAIALAESSGDPDEYDPETAFFAEHNIPAGVSAGRGSVGLWQIFRYEHPEFDRWDLRDPQLSAFAASLVFRRSGSSFAPWSSFSSGRYRQYLEIGGTAA